MHAAKACVELLRLDPTLKICGWGGDDMRNAGVEVRRDVSTLAMMGFLEVVKRIFFVKKVFSECKAMILEIQPDAIVYVDYSGFNLRMAEWSHKQGFKNLYYIPPKTWAWNQSRTHKLRKFVDKVYAILPFEKAFFEGYDVDVTYVGNPVVDTVRNCKFDVDFADLLPKEKPIVALVPGSRRSELENILPAMLQLVEAFPQFQFVVCGVISVDEYLYNDAKNLGVPIYFDKFYDVLHHANYAIVTSGTATLETAIMNVPQIVCFKTSYLSYLIAKSLIKVKFISLVNLIADDNVVEELIQEEINAKSLADAFKRLQENRGKVLADYEVIRQKLGNTNASLSVANEILREIN